MIKMNWGAWIGIIGGAIGLLIGIASVLLVAGDVGIYIALGMLILFGGMFYLFYKLLFQPMINMNRLQKTGLSGTAVIREVRDTGVTVNNNPQVKLMLEVKSSLGSRYHAQTKILVSRINPGACRVGAEIPVKIDPNNELNVVVDLSNTQKKASFKQAEANTPWLQSELEQWQQENEAIVRSGKPARAIVKKLTTRSTNVNGNNLYVELELEVLPEFMPAFPGTAKGVIAEASLHKYQPGNTIYVKHDLYDDSKIVIDPSPALP